MPSDVLVEIAFGHNALHGDAREVVRRRVGVLPNGAAGKATQECGIAAAARDGSRSGYAVDRFFAEITAQLFRRRHVVVDRSGGGVLVHVFVASPEKQFLAALVKIGERDEDGTANVPAHVVEVLRRVGQPFWLLL